MFSNFKLVCHRQKLNKRKIFHFNKADWDQVRSAVNFLRRDYFSRNLNDISVDEHGFYCMPCFLVFFSRSLFP